MCIFTSNLLLTYFYHNVFPIHNVGSIPSSFGDFTNLKYLIALHVPLSGSLPWQLGYATNLEVLVISLTQIGGMLFAVIC